MISFPRYPCISLSFQSMNASHCKHVHNKPSAPRCLQSSSYLLSLFWSWQLPICKRAVGQRQLLPFPYTDISGMCWSVSGRFPYQCWGVALCVSFYAYLVHSFGWMTSLQCGTMCPITWQTTSAWWQPAGPAVTWAVSHVYVNDIKCYFVKIPIFALWLCMWVACITATHTMLNDNNVPAEVLLIACQNGNHSRNTVVSVCRPSMPGPGQEGLACQTSWCGTIVGITSSGWQQTAVWILHDCSLVILARTIHKYFRRFGNLRLPFTNESVSQSLMKGYQNSWNFSRIFLASMNELEYVPTPSDCSNTLENTVFMNSATFYRCLRMIACAFEGSAVSTSTTLVLMDSTNCLAETLCCCLCSLFVVSTLINSCDATQIFFVCCVRPPTASKVHFCHFHLPLCLPREHEWLWCATDSKEKQYFKLHIRCAFWVVELLSIANSMSYTCASIVLANCGNTTFKCMLLYSDWLKYTL